MIKVVFFIHHVNTQTNVGNAVDPESFLGALGVRHDAKKKGTYIHILIHT